MSIVIAFYLGGVTVFSAWLFVDNYRDGKGYSYWHAVAWPVMILLGYIAILAEIAGDRADGMGD